jgi:hypothetical protein
MTIKVHETLTHWNYYLALDSDLMHVSRFVEFSEHNFTTYSIELAHILLAASSEVDVMAKAVCAILEPGATAENINHYKSIIIRGIPELPPQTVHVPRFGLMLNPWSNWKGDRNPDWWRSYNDVKHHRDQHFQDASLKNSLNSLGALLIINFHYYRLKAGLDLSTNGKKDTTRHLKPEAQLMQLDNEYYYSHLIV